MQGASPQQHTQVPPPTALAGSSGSEVMRRLRGAKGAVLFAVGIAVGALTLPFLASQRQAEQPLAPAGTGSAGLLPLSRTAAGRRSKQRRELRELLDDLGHAQYLRALVEEGIDRVEFAAAAQQSDADAAGVDPKDWAEINQAAKRQMAAAAEPDAEAQPSPQQSAKAPARSGAGASDVQEEESIDPKPAAAAAAPEPAGAAAAAAAPAPDSDDFSGTVIPIGSGTRCPAGCERVHRAQCRSAFINLKLAAPQLIEPAANTAIPPGCWYRPHNAKSQPEFGFNTARRAVPASPEWWMLCQCPNVRRHMAILKGQCSDLCRPVRSKEECNAASKALGYPDVKASLNSAQVADKRPPGCHYRVVNRGTQNDLFYNANLQSHTRASPADFVICDCTPPTPAPTPEPAESDDDEGGARQPKNEGGGRELAVSKRSASGAHPQVAARELVNSWVAKYSLPDIPPSVKESWLNEQKAAHAKQRSAAANTPNEYEQREQIAAAALRKLPLRVKQQAGAAAGWHRYRTLDSQERVEIVATITGKTPDEVIISALGEAQYKLMKSGAQGDKTAPASGGRGGGAASAAASAKAAAGTPAPPAPLPAALVEELKGFEELRKMGALNALEYSLARAKAFSQAGVPIPPSPPAAA
eukprot:TRINITY_DN19421_c0_g3_i1.p1 TRINITY_DN19421_c0_g3~~TRINITY_DN19421_c0_g3_i1.p1  ORF type:complete len:642 (+),score=123.13 TRINITY_DN19421_c0_g3_i1:86-2011(+)